MVHDITTRQKCLEGIVFLCRDGTAVVDVADDDSSVDDNTLNNDAPEPDNEILGVGEDIGADDDAREQALADDNISAGGDEMHLQPPNGDPAGVDNNGMNFNDNNEADDAMADVIKADTQDDAPELIPQPVEPEECINMDAT